MPKRSPRPEQTPQQWFAIDKRTFKIVTVTFSQGYLSSSDPEIKPLRVPSYREVKREMRVAFGLTELRVRHFLDPDEGQTLKELALKAAEMKEAAKKKKAG